MSASAIRAGAAYIELQLRDGVSRPLHHASVALKEFGNNVAWQGAKIAALGTAITAPLAAMAHTFARSALESGRFANRRDAANVSAYVSAVTALSNAMTNLRNALGSAVLPLMTRWPAALARIVNQAAVWVTRNRPLVQAIALLASRVALAGAAIVVLGKGIATAGSVLGFLSGVASAAATGIAMIGGILAAIMTPLGLVIAGLVALGAYLLYASGVGEQAINWLGEAFGGLGEDAGQAIQGIIDSLVAGDIEQAAKVFWSFLKLEWEKGRNALNQIWIDAKEFFLNVWSNASFDAAGYFIDAWAIVENGWVETVDFLADVWSIFTSGLMKAWHSTIGFIKKAWVNLKALFDKDINVDAEVTRINQETNARNQAVDDQQNQVIGDRNERRKNRKAEIEQGRQAARANLGQDQAAQQNAAAIEFQRQRDESEQRVGQAQGDFNRDRKDAAGKRAKIKPPDPSGLLIPMKSEQAKLESKGSFNAMAVRGLGSSSLADRTAKATEKSVDLLKDIKKNTEDGGPVFA
jgi:hypothetical protein